MDYTRRELGFLLPLLAATGAEAQDVPVLLNRIYHSRDIALAGDEKKSARNFFYGKTHGGFNVQVHETHLGVSVQTHEPHRHEHEEIIIVVEGSVETWVEGKTELAEQGSVIYYASNLLHSAKNGGDIPCKYYVIELRDKA